MKKKRRFSKGKIFINLLPYITVIGLGTGFAVHTFGGEIVDRVNTWKIQNEYTKRNAGFDLNIPSIDDIKDYLGFNKEEVEVVDITPAVDTEPLVITVVPENEQVVEEEVVEEPEPIIYPEYTSSELLDSGYEFLDIDFDGLKEQNEDVVGWIDIPGTTISYPVVQGEDNNYYLHHDLDGKDSHNGTIFIDSRVDLTHGDDSSTVQESPIGFYGHHMKSGKMFKPIVNYKTAGYVDSHPYAVYYSPEGVYKLEIFADQYVDGNSDEGLYTNQLFSEESYEEFIDNIRNNSSFTTDTDVSFGDKVGYLITCTYERDNLRYAVWYKAIKQYTNEIDRQESVEVAKTLTLN